MRADDEYDWRDGDLSMIRILCLLLFALPAWADTYYVKCDAATNGAGTFADPRNTFVGITTAAGDVFRLWPNVVCGADKAQGSDAIIEVLQNDDGVTIELAPELGAPPCDSRSGDGCWILDGNNTVNIGVYGVNNDTMMLRDGWLRNFEYHNFRHWGTDAQNFSVELHRVRLQQAGPTVDSDVTYSQLSKGTCGFVGRASNAQFRTTLLSYDLTIDTCSRLGFDHRWQIIATHHRYYGARTGYDRLIGGHGISGHPVGADYTSGWTYQSGTCPGADCVYSRPVASATDDEQLIWDRTTGVNRKFQRVADGNTSPAEGYFSKVSSTLYVGFGYDPNGNSVRLIRQNITVDCFDCEFTENYLRDDGNIEGSGFHADDTTPMRCIRCKSYDNEGNGFYFNHTAQYWSGARARCEACIAWNNGKANCTGATCGKGIGSTGEVDVVNSVAHNSLAQNFEIAGRNNACGLFANNVATGSPSIGMRFRDDAISLCAAQANVAFGNGTNFANFSGTVADPQFLGGPNPTTVEGFIPLAPELFRAGTPVGSLSDFGGCAFAVPPSIGAWEMACGSRRVDRDPR